MRIFLPATAAGLAAARSAGEVGGEVGPAPRPAFAVTAALRESWPDGDEEELALAATEAAAWHSLVGLAAEATAPSAAAAEPGSSPERRIVLVADVPDGWVTPADGGTGDGAVVIDRPVLLESVVSVLADGAGLAAEVRAALPAITAGHLADEVDDSRAVAADPSLAALREVLASPLLWFEPDELWHSLAE